MRRAGESHKIVSRARQSLSEPPGSQKKQIALMRDRYESQKLIDEKCEPTCNISSRVPWPLGRLLSMSLLGTSVQTDCHAPLSRENAPSSSSNLPRAMMRHFRWHHRPRSDRGIGMLHDSPPSPAAHAASRADGNNRPLCHAPSSLRAVGRLEWRPRAQLGPAALSPLHPPYLLLLAHTHDPRPTHPRPRRPQTQPPHKAPCTCIPPLLHPRPHPSVDPPTRVLGWRG